MIEHLIADAAQAIGGALRPGVLLGSGEGSLRAALQIATAEAFQPLAMLGGVLLCIGLVQNLIRQSDAPRDMTMTIARTFVLAILIFLSQRPEWRGLVPAISSEMAGALTKSKNGLDEPLKKVSHFVELIYPAEDLKPVKGAEAKGAAKTAWYDFAGQAADAVFGAIALTMRTYIAMILIMAAFALLYVGWVIGLVVVWLSVVLFEYGWLLAPLALAALGMESSRAIGNTYLLGLISVGCGQVALALAHVGTNALMIWVAELLRTITAVPAISELVKAPANDFIRGKFVNSVALLPAGGLLAVFLAFLVLALWIVVTPVFAWKVFMSTLRTGAQFGSRLGFAFAGATLRAAGNAAEVAGSRLAANAGNGGSKKAAVSASAAGGAASGEVSSTAPSSVDRGGISPARDEAAVASTRPRLGGEKLAATRQRVAEAAARGRAAGKSDDEVELMCRSVAIQSGASAAEAAEIVRDVQGGATDRAPAPAADVTAASRQTSAGSRSSEKDAAPAEPAGPLPAAYALTLAAAALRRASAHANEGFPDPTDNGLVAAHQRAQPKPRGQAS